MDAIFQIGIDTCLIKWIGIMMRQNHIKYSFLVSVIKISDSSYIHSVTAGCILTVSVQGDARL